MRPRAARLTNAYSRDLQWRIVWHNIIARGHTYQTAAKHLCVSVGTVFNIIKLFENTGEVYAKPSPSRPSLHSLTDHEELLVFGVVLENSTFELKEIRKIVQDATGTSVSNATLCRLLKRYGMTRKKIQRIALQKSTELGGQFMAEVQYFPKKCLYGSTKRGVTGCNHMRQYGYSLRGYRASEHTFLARGQRINSIAAISTNGLICYELYQSKINSEVFYDFLRGSLIPNMLLFDGSNNDNVSFHHSDIITEILRDVGILVLFLPPYSPDYNPIEEAFSYIKHYLKDHESIMDIVSPLTILSAAFNSITSHQCLGWIEHIVVTNFC